MIIQIKVQKLFYLSVIVFIIGMGVRYFLEMGDQQEWIGRRTRLRNGEEGPYIWFHDLTPVTLGVFHMAHRESLLDMLTILIGESMPIDTDPDPSPKPWPARMPHRAKATRQGIEVDFCDGHQVFLPVMGIGLHDLFVMVVQKLEDPFQYYLCTGSLSMGMEADAEGRLIRAENQGNQGT